MSAPAKKLDIRDLDLDVETCDAVFTEVAGLVGVDPGRVVAALRAREAEGSTEVDDLALPHACVEGLDHGVLLDIHLAHEVRWGKGQVKRCFCVLTSPEDRGEHATLLAEAARRAFKGD